jgi:hypothetical protein
MTAILVPPRPRLALSVLAFLLLAGLASAQSETAVPPEELRRMQERATAATATGDQHEALSYFLGEWDVEIELVMPGVPSQKSRGKATSTWVIQNRWVGETLEGTLFGAPYRSFVLRGFDSYAKNHVVATVRSMDNSLNVARGVVVDPKGQVTALYGTLDEYTTDELDKPFKVVTRRLDSDRFVVEIWDLGIGTDGAKVLEFRYTRKPS